MIGKTISHYRILEKLGEGGMGVVYKAEDTKLGRPVALKFLPPELTRDDEANKRFIQEARAASALDHPNICTVHEIDETNEGQTFIAMACYEGESLKAKIERGPLKLDEALEIATQTAQGLAKAHGEGIIHRDIKPANILVTKDGLVKIVDFGLAKLAGTKATKTGKTLGTAQYMSPEQARGENVDARSDIFSLGAVLYEMLTGRHAFPGEYEQAALYAILNQNPEPVTALRSGIPMEFERIVMKMLVKSPAERYQRLDDFLVDLRALKKQVESRGEPIVRPRVRSRRRGIAIAIAAAAVIVAVGALVMRSVFSHRTGPIDSIAVLPLENLSGDPAQEYFADGMTEALITDLANIGALKVISRTSVMRFKDTKEPLPKIARELGVDAVIEGSVLLVGDRVRITAQLIEAQADRHIWAESYERNIRDILSLQQEVAREIAKAIKVALTPAEEATLTKAVQVDPKVHDLYLRGRYHWNKRTAEDLAKSIEYFQKVIEIDPRFALAYIALADAYTVIGNWGYRDPREMFALAKHYAEKALEIDSQLSQPYAVLAGVEIYLNFNWQEAERLYEEAIELNQNNATAHQWYAEFLSARGRQEEALAEIDKSLAIDPLSLIANQNRAVVLLREKRYNEALAQCRKTLDLDKEFRSVHLTAAYCYAGMGRFPDFVAELQEAMARDENGRRYADEAGRVFRQTGIEGLTRWMIKDIDEVSGTPYDSPYAKAQLHAMLGEKDQAIEWMKKAVEVRSPSVVTWKVDPAFDALRNDPRFMTVIREAGLE
jgi:serine/threonine protein kinase/tetratricopeptide (TPR) repeat protein